MSTPVSMKHAGRDLLSFQPLHAEEIRNYFMDHLQAKDEGAHDGVEGAPDPEDLAAQVDDA
jgi:hypothetical protein